jgi:hypothetical protein
MADLSVFVSTPLENTFALQKAMNPHGLLQAVKNFKSEVLDQSLESLQDAAQKCSKKHLHGAVVRIVLKMQTTTRDFEGGISKTNRMFRMALNTIEKEREANKKRSEKERKRGEIVYANLEARVEKEEERTRFDIRKKKKQLNQMVRKMDRLKEETDNLERDLPLRLEAIKKKNEESWKRFLMFRKRREVMTNREYRDWTKLTRRKYGTADPDWAAIMEEGEGDSDGAD